MALTINTNVASLIAQRNLQEATNALNTAIERMTTGYKINHAGDNAAGYSIASLWKTHISTLDVASDNAATGGDLLTTAEETYSLVLDHVQRIRDLTEQAGNGTYGSVSLKAINTEITARLNEINRIAANAEFNGVKLMNGTVGTNGIKLQVGLYGDTNSQIVLAQSLFAKTDVVSLFKDVAGITGATSVDATATLLSGYVEGACKSDQATYLSKIDDVVENLSGRVTDIGAAQNRVDSAVAAIEVQSRNLVSSLSTLRDTDVAEESSNYIQAQILQQASATLLSTANQLPSIALNLI